MTTPRILVLGIGNLLMGDEGVGVHVVRQLEPSALPEGVSVVDGGTGGFHLLEYLTDHDQVILIDATMDGRPAGSVTVLEPKYASDFPRALTAHDIGLRDLIEAAVLVGPLPKLWLVTVSIETIQPMSIDMSRDVEAAVPAAIAQARDLIASILQSPCTGV